MAVDSDDMFDPKTGLPVAEDELTSEEDGEDEDDDGGDGDDQASLALNTPEPARALQASKPVAKKGKGDPKSKKGLKDRAARESQDGRGIDIAISDAATGLEESSTQETETPATQETSAFDRDEIVESDRDIHETELLSMLAGLSEKPWQNENLSAAERMTMIEGYERNLAALKQNLTDHDPDARKQAGNRRTATAAGIAVAAGVAAAGAMTGHAADKQGPNVAGVSRGPQRAADQNKDNAASQASQARIKNQTQNQTGIGMEERKRAAEGYTAQAARQTIEESAARRTQSGPTTTAILGKTDLRSTETPEPTLSDRLLQDMIEDQAVSGDTVIPSIEAAPSDPDMQFRQVMEMIYMFIGPAALNDVSPHRVAGWDEKRQEQRENSADVTAAPELKTPSEPTPDLDYRRDMPNNLGPGGSM